MEEISAGPTAGGGRDCGSCTLCCRVLGVAEIDKPEGQSCAHCSEGVGCLIHGAHPEQCRAFTCGFLVMPDLGEEWRPSTAKLIVVPDEDTRRMRIHVDPLHPDAWRAAPYYARLKHWSEIAVRNRMLVVVHIGRRAIVVLPGEEIDLGIMSNEDAIQVAEEAGPHGTAYRVAKVLLQQG